MRWYALAVFWCLAVYFMVNRARAGSRAAARRHLEKHLGSGDDSGAAGRLARFVVRLNERIDSTRYAGRLREALERSGFDITWETFKLLWLGAVTMLPLLSYALSGNWLSIPPAVLFALALPRPVLFTLRRRGEQKNIAQCDRLACDLALYLSCGIPIEQSLALCAFDLSRPLSDSLRQFSAQTAMGTDSGSALLNLIESLGNADLDLIARAAVASRETGADISEIMGTIGEAVRERAVIRRDLQTQTVQARLSGRIVAGLPFLFLGLAALVSKSTLSVLLGTVPGLIMLAVAAVMNVIGFLWMRKILDINT
jgi:tight adherence protein B